MGGKQTKASQQSRWRSTSARGCVRGRSHEGCVRGLCLEGGVLCVARGVSRADGATGGGVALLSPSASASASGSGPRGACATQRSTWIVLCSAAFLRTRTFYYVDSHPLDSLWHSREKNHENRELPEICANL